MVTTLDSAPVTTAPVASASALLEVTNLTKHFPIRRGLLSREVGRVHAVNNVSFSIGPGETLGLVGESGCGKTTIGRSLLRLIEPTGGSIRFGGVELVHLPQS